MSKEQDIQEALHETAKRRAADFNAARNMEFIADTRLAARDALAAILNAWHEDDVLPDRLLCALVAARDAL